MGEETQWGSLSVDCNGGKKQKNSAKKSQQLTTN